MIYYNRSACISLSTGATIKAALVQRTLKTSCGFGLLAGCIAWAVKFADLQYAFLEYIMPENLVYGSFTSAVGFLLVFRVGQSYQRFTEGATLMHLMASDYLDTAALLMCMSRCGSACEASKLHFRRVVVRLVSCLNMLCLYELGGVSVQDVSTLRSKCIDVDGLDEDTLRIIDNSLCKADVAAQLLQNVICKALDDELNRVPPPLLTRVFQELGGGMIRFHEALKLRNVPCPFPLLVVTEVLLMTHSFYTAFQMSFANQGAIGAAVFSSGFTFLAWSLYGLAMELDDPFGTDDNDLDLNSTQKHLNHRLLSMLSTSVAPSTTLTAEAADETQLLYDLGEQELLFRQGTKDSIVITNNSEGEAVPIDQDDRDFLIRDSRSYRDGEGSPRFSIHCNKEPAVTSFGEIASAAEIDGGRFRDTVNAEQPGVCEAVLPQPQVLPPSPSIPSIQRVMDDWVVAQPPKLRVESPNPRVGRRR